MRVIISAGGTGGHIYPALAILDKIKEKDKDAKILYIGTTDRMEKDIVPKAGFKYKGINVKVSKKVIEELVSKSNFEEYGARKLDKLIKDKLETIIIDKVLLKQENVSITSLEVSYN